MNAAHEQFRTTNAEISMEQVRARPLLGTIVEISAAGYSPESVQVAIARAFDAIEKVHRLMSYQHPDSEVSCLNRWAHEKPVKVSAHTWHVLKTASAISESSDGLFDITIAPTLTRLGFLPKQQGMPKSNEKGNWRHVMLLPDHQVHFARKLRIDLSGIAKGYAVDLAAQALKDSGITSARINAGGDMRLFGEKSQTIHVRMPDAPAQTVPLLNLTCGSVATSAGYFASREHKGEWVTPLVNPLTRKACRVGQSVTVLAEECMIADALTKIVHIDPSRSATTLDRFNARALIMDTDPDSGNYRIFDSSK